MTDSFISGCAGFVLIVIGLIIVVVVFALGVDFTLTVNNSVGWVWQDRKGIAVQSFGEEKDGCISFVDVYGGAGEACGNYVIDHNGN